MAQAVRFWGQSRPSNRDSEACKRKLVEYLSKRHLVVRDIDAETRNNNCMFVSLRVAVGNRQVDDVIINVTAKLPAGDQELRQAAVDMVETIVATPEHDQYELFEIALRHEVANGGGDMSVQNWFDQWSAAMLGTGMGDSQAQQALCACATTWPCTFSCHRHGNAEHHNGLTQDAS